MSLFNIFSISLVIDYGTQYTDITILSTTSTHTNKQEQTKATGGGLTGVTVM